MARRAPFFLPACAERKGPHLGMPYAALLSMGKRGLGAGDELEQTRAPLLGLAPRAPERAGDLARIVDPLAPAAQFPRQRRIVAASIKGVVGKQNNVEIP